MNGQNYEREKELDTQGSGVSTKHPAGAPTLSCPWFKQKELELVSFSAITFLFDFLTPGVHIPEGKFPLLNLTFSNVLIHTRWSDSTEEGATHSSDLNEVAP